MLIGVEIVSYDYRPVSFPVAAVHRFEVCVNVLAVAVVPCFGHVRSGLHLCILHAACIYVLYIYSYMYMMPQGCQSGEMLLWRSSTNLTPLVQQFTEVYANIIQLLCMMYGKEYTFGWGFNLPEFQISDLYGR